MTLALADFPPFFTAVHDGHAPYDWQIRLLAQVAERGWPRVIAAPTGAGKTAVLDIALFHLALDLARRGPRRAPMRIVFAVDRRVIVDQAYEHARHLLRRLESSELAPIARPLRGDADHPLKVTELRGGMPREDDWARSPAQPTILCTTVDQLGSRLLFRGYGVSDSMAPLHAGLLGEDALLLLDEAHLSRPFAETLDAIAARREQRDMSPGLPWAFCELTATTRATASTSVFRLSAAEREEPAIRQRLNATKTADLEITKSETGTEAHARALAEAARRLRAESGLVAPTVSVIVNRVALARAVWRELVPPEDEAAPHEAILLTGRVRPTERDELIRAHGDRLERPETAPEDATPLFVVATQCIEAGADFDFDAMVTQLAPLDALRQRFGRLNRRGRRAQARAVVLASAEELRAKYDDRLYRDRLKPTWDWLVARATAPRRGEAPSLSVSPEAFARAEAEDAAVISTLAVPTLSAPVLRAADLDFFSMTNPSPLPDPYLPLFLHGPVDDVAEVAIVWRADISAADLAAAHDGEGARRLADLLAVVPPRPGEALRLPLWAARHWLRDHAHAADVSDSDAEAAPAGDAQSAGGRPVLRWRGEASEIAFASRLRPGDTIVVPASYGGCDRFGWACDHRDPVVDIADDAAAPYFRHYAPLRLHAALLDPAAWSAVSESLQAEHPSAETIREVAEAHAVAGAKRLDGAAGLKLEFLYDDDDDGPRRGAVLVAPRGFPELRPAEISDAIGGGSATEDDPSSLADRGGPVELAAHVGAVVERVTTFASRLGLPVELRATLAFAAEHHDDGKCDPRFQEYLAGPRGSNGALLAKSGRRLGLAADRLAREAAGLPAQWRHEVLSVRAATALLTGATDGLDAGLALFLIGTHHGQGRPFFRHDDPWDAHGHEIGGLSLQPGPGPERLDFDWFGRDWAELFDELRRRYGVWGLALLEAVLRLADHRASEAA